MKKKLFKVLVVASTFIMLATATAAAYGGHGQRYVDANNDGVCDYYNGERCGYGNGYYCDYSGYHHGGQGMGYGGHCRR
ncbi:MAG: hypothetical protein ACLRQ0_11125 [Monoglobales bacterium]